MRPSLTVPPEPQRDLRREAGAERWGPEGARAGMTVATLPLGRFSRRGRAGWGGGGGGGGRGGSRRGMGGAPWRGGRFAGGGGGVWGGGGGRGGAGEEGGQVQDDSGWPQRSQVGGRSQGVPAKRRPKAGAPGRG